MKQLKNNPVTNNELKGKVNTKDRTLEHYISSERVNAYGYNLRTKGMNDTDYRNNPQVLYHHFAGDNFFSAPSRPSDTIIGTNLKLTKHKDGFISAVTKFAETELGEEIMQFNIAGLLNAWSIGWGWLNPENIENDILEEDGKITVLNWKLMEYSSVPLPANPDATNKLALETMLSESKVPLLQQSLSMALLKVETNSEMRALKEGYNKLYEQYLEFKDSAKNTDVEKTLKDFKNQIKAELGQTVKEINSKIFTLAGSLNGISGKLLDGVMKSIPTMLDEAVYKGLRKITGKLE